MKTISVTDEEYEFLTALAHELRTQDNRCTASPYYYSVRTTRKLFAPDGYGVGQQQFVDPEDSELIYSSPSDAIESLMSNGMTVDEAERAFGDFESFGTYEIPEYNNVFLTFKGYQEHIRLNKHNYSSELDSFVHYADRNPEMDKLLKFLRKIGGV